MKACLQAVAKNEGLLAGRSPKRRPGGDERCLVLFQMNWEGM